MNSASQNRTQNHNTPAVGVQGCTEHNKASRAQKKAIQLRPYGEIGMEWTTQESGFDFQYKEGALH
jgi:hypothetical protein